MIPFHGHEQKKFRLFRRRQADKQFLHGIPGVRLFLVDVHVIGGEKHHIVLFHQPRGKQFPPDPDTKHRIQHMVPLCCLTAATIPRFGGMIIYRIDHVRGYPPPTVDQTRQGNPHLHPGH
jgi:hypothetical protein